MRLTTRVRCRDCASSVRRVRKNQISCSNSSKLTVFSQIRWMKLQRRYANTEEACCRRQSIHSLPHLVFCFFLQRSLQQVRYLSSAPRTVECRPRVKGRSLSFPLRIYRLGWKKWPFYSCTQFSFSDSLCHIHLLEDGIADLQVAGEEPSIADVDAYLDVWLFIVTASSIFDGCNFMVRATVLLNP